MPLWHKLNLGKGTDMTNRTRCVGANMFHFSSGEGTETVDRLVIRSTVGALHYTFDGGCGSRLLGYDVALEGAQTISDLMDALDEVGGVEGMAAKARADVKDLPGYSERIELHA